jgi:hypothetical protein
LQALDEKYTLKFIDLEGGRVTPMYGSNEGSPRKYMSDKRLEKKLTNLELKFDEKLGKIKSQI